jgi:hypothetical protein
MNEHLDDAAVQGAVDAAERQRDANLTTHRGDTASTQPASRPRTGHWRDRRPTPASQPVARTFRPRAGSARADKGKE